MNKYGELRPAEERKRTERLHKAQLKINKERIKPVINLLKTNYSTGIVMLPGAKPDVVRNGLDAISQAPDQVLWLPAQGTIQGSETDDDTALHILEKVRNLKREHGRYGIVVLSDVTYDQDGAGSGTPLLRGYFERAVAEQRKIPYKQRTRPAVLVVGHGTREALPSSGNLALLAGDFLGSVTVRAALLGTGEFTTWVPPVSPENEQTRTMPIYPEQPRRPGYTFPEGNRPH